MISTSAAEEIAQLVDEGSFQQWSGSDAESVISGSARVHGIEVAVIVSDVSFKGGSVGVSAAHRLIHAFETATARALPVLALPRSGGTRMQDGTAGFIAMLGVVDAIVRHTSARLPYVVHIGNPTTGGTLASWAALGHYTMADPKALVALLGPRVVRAIYNFDPDPHLLTADSLLAAGHVDTLGDVPDFRGKAAQFLRLVQSHEAAPSQQSEPGNTYDAEFPTLASSPPCVPGTAVKNTARKPVKDGWDLIQLSRDENRERPWLSIVESSTSLELGSAHGGVPETGIRTFLTSLVGRTAVVLFQGLDIPGQEFALEPRFTKASFLQANRGLDLAASLGLPVLNVVDTPGVSIEPDSDTVGLAMAIAKLSARLASFDTPVLTLLAGRGTGAGAIGLMSADRVVALEDSWLAPLPMEGASAILYRDSCHAPQLAREQGITAQHLTSLGLVHSICPAGVSPGDLVTMLAEHLAELCDQAADDRRRTAFAARQTV